MTVEVALRLYAHPRDVVGTKTLTRTVSDGATVGDVLEDLFVEFPSLEEHLLDDDGTLAATAVVRKNRTNVSLEDAVADGDELSLTTQVVGGARSPGVNCRGG
ncbi:MAG: ubiquitin-like small modifier protein 1 [Haloarculaceae archaeon]